MSKQSFIATSNDNQRKLLKFLSSIYKKVPLSKLHKTLRNGDVKINSKRTKDFNYIIQENDIIEVYGLNDNDSLLTKFNSSITLTSEIIYEDNNIILINKKEGVEVHGNSNSLDQQVYSYLNFEQNTSFKPSHVGRLDKVTSGLIVYAKNYESLVELNKANNAFDKDYIFVPEAKITDNLYSLFISKNESQKRMIITDNETKNSQLAITNIEWINGQYHAKIITGKKHQIRATCAYLNAPIVGDTKYGAKAFRRVLLHSYSLKFKNLEGNLSYLNDKTFSCKPKNWV
ncbi:RluA family pseudouridine synthase [Mycoplasma sp. HS2188]|uniref:RluA family pseudouridine synthase n=1 Tax=Mycoplasma sp. HS2188 TaxID=2976765 RepID=UPI0021AAE575|nr:RluA family pseudouridine synthase [Mycoplasma sp. HS2188]MCT4469837.1 RluA family pseudouridine synthase [Mycoplasma sp. HS2188]